MHLPDQKKYCKVHDSMDTLPISIEDHLADAGFSGTEVLLLRHLFSGQQFTIRELASKTGKSTGLLDQCIKKLIRKSIVQREMVNEVPKYTIHSVMSLSNYLRQHLHENINRLKRREEDVESYLSTLTQSSHRPHIEYFEGKKGIIQVWHKLIQDVGTNDILGYIPLTNTINTEYSDVQDEVVKLRRTARVHARFLTHDTLLGKRYQEKDIFCDRQTKFIASDRCLLNVAHVFSSTLYACIDYQLQSAYIIVFSDLVREKRALFEGHWVDADSHSEQVTPPVHTQVTSSRYTKIKLQYIISVTVCTTIIATYLLSLLRTSAMYSQFPLLSLVDFFGILLLVGSAVVYYMYPQYIHSALQATGARVSYMMCVLLSVLLIAMPVLL